MILLVDLVTSSYSNPIQLNFIITENSLEVRNDGRIIVTEENQAFMTFAVHDSWS